MLTYKPINRPAKSRNEDLEQIDFVQWVKCHYPDLAKFMVAPINEIKAPIHYQDKLNKMGRRKGAHDVLFLTAPMFTIEFKKASGGAVSKQQTEFGEVIESQGGTATVCYGCEQAKIAFKEFYKLS
jgi:hypothetical protein